MSAFEVLKEQLGDSNISFTVWCSGCNAEPAITTLEGELLGEETSIDVGRECLTTLLEAGRIEE